MFTINSWGSGLITTGMIFCRDLPGLRQYRLLNLTVTTVLLLVQFLFCFPPGNDLVFHGLLGLTAPLDRIARDTMHYAIRRGDPLGQDLEFTKIDGLEWRVGFYADSVVFSNAILCVRLEK